MGFSPEGPTYYDYEAWAPVGNGALAPGATNVEWFAVANSDIDGDTVNNEWGIQVPDAQGNLTAPAFATLACTGNTILDGAGVPGMMSQVGRCGLAMGFSVF